MERPIIDVIGITARDKWIWVITKYTGASPQFAELPNLESQVVKMPFYRSPSRYRIDLSRLNVQEQKVASADPLWWKLNQDEKYSLLESKKQLTLLVKQYAGAGGLVQGNSTKGFLDKLMFWEGKWFPNKRTRTNRGRGLR